MRREWLWSAFAAGLIGLVYLLTGLRPNTLPFIPNSRFSDATTSHYPAALFLHDSVWVLREFPLWRETTFAGAPFAANPLNKTAYPLQWLAVFLPPIPHLQMMIVLHIGLAAAGMWRWARSLGLRVEAAALATVAYALAPRLVAHLGAGHLDLVYAMAWFPWLMWSARQFGSTPRLTMALLVALTAGLLFLADTRLALFALPVAVGYGLLQARKQSGWRLLLWSALAGGIVLALTVSLWLPLIGWQPYLSRAGLSVGEAGVFAFEYSTLITFFVPALPGGTPELLAYSGLVVFALALVAFISRWRQLWGWALLILVCAVYALGVNGFLYPILTRLFSFLLLFRVPSRAWLVVALVLPLLAAYGVQALLAARQLRSMRNATVFATLLIGLCAVELFIFSGRAIHWRSEAQWLTPYQTLAETLKADGADRVYSPTYSLTQEAAETYGINLFGGVDPFQIRSVADSIAEAGGIPPLPYSIVAPPLLNIEGDDPATANRDAAPNTTQLAQWDVSHVVAAYPLEHPQLELLSTVQTNADVYVYQNLDYTPSSTGETIPNWPAASNLPNMDNVARLNDLNITAALVSWLALGGVLITMIVIRLLRRQESA